MTNDQSNRRTTNIHSGTMRRRLLSGGAMALCLATLIAHGRAQAQSSTSGQAFQGTGTVVSGTANIQQTAALDTITVTTPQAVINWKPNDTSGTGTIDFLPVGRSARFTGFADFTVLNRIIPVDGSDVPIARMIALNGTITSDLFGSQPGGNVWFYSPGGILVGSTGVINVGSLVLTSRDIDTTGGLFGTSGEIRFRDPAIAGTATSRVEIASRASITAFNGTAGGSYIALVAPRIVQAGTVSVDGSVALVAAEQADIRINNGLFDINILAGSSDANGIVHSGTTGGPSGAGNRAYFVAVPKNQAMTMLLSGTIGFETASTATLSEGGIVLSAGHNIVGGVLSDSANGNSTGSIQIDDTIFLNTLNGAATDGITGRPSTSCAPLCSATSTAGQIQFRKDATLSAFNGGIDFQLGTLVSALGILDLQGDFVRFDRLASGNLSRIRADTNITGNRIDAGSVDFASRNGNIAVDTIDAVDGIIMTALNGLVSGGTATSKLAGIEIDARDVDYDQLFAAEMIDIAASGNVILDFAQTEPGNIQSSGLGQSPQANGPSDILIVTGGNVALGQLIAADRIDISAATLTGANSALSAGDDIEINTSGNAEFGTLDANDGLVVTSLGAVTGTRATTLIGTAGIALNGANGVNVATVRSRGRSTLTATNGALEIGTLTSGDLITANGRSIVIGGSGGLTFAALNATAGDASVIASSGDLLVRNGTITGTATLTTQGGALTVDDLTANRIALTSNTTATITGTVIGTNALNITSTGATIVDGDKATGGVITITSGDIVIDEGHIGTRGTTSAVTLVNGDGSVRTYVGGNDQANAYSLSAAEMLQIFGTNVTIRAPLVTAQSGAALGSTRPPDVIIGAFTFNVATASTGNLGAGGTLSIITPGSARVVGAAQLTNMTSSNGFTLQADQGIEVILGQGSIRLTGAGSGALGGVLSLKADDIAVATGNAISDIAIASDIAAINTRLGRNDGVTSADGAISAATINFDATSGLYIQNSGASDRNNDRRGFTTNALNITSGGTTTRIVINGQIANGVGLFQNGADTIRSAMINGVTASAGGAFAQGSTINSCLIANPAGCNAVANFDQNDFIKNQIGTNARRRPTIRRLLLLGLGRSAIHMRDEPLVDEPITGSGNDDLWTGEPDGE